MSTLNQNPNSHKKNPWKPHHHLLIPKTLPQTNIQPQTHFDPIFQLVTPKSQPTTPKPKRKTNNKNKEREREKVTYLSRSQATTAQPSSSIWASISLIFDAAQLHFYHHLSSSRSSVLLAFAFSPCDYWLTIALREGKARTLSIISMNWSAI